MQLSQEDIAQNPGTQIYRFLFTEKRGLVEPKEFLLSGSNQLCLILPDVCKQCFRSEVLKIGTY